MPRQFYSWYSPEIMSYFCNGTLILVYINPTGLAKQSSQSTKTFKFDWIVCLSTMWAKKNYTKIRFGRLCL